MRSIVTCRVLVVGIVLAGCAREPDARDTAPPHADEAEHEVGVVTLTAAADSTLGATVVQAEAVTRAGGTLTVPGVVAADPAREELISPRIAGRLERLLATVGTRVRQGEPLAELSSPEFLAAQEELRLAAERQRMLAGSADSTLVRALVAAARRRLTQAGADTALLTRLEGGGAPEAHLVIRAPRAGSLVEQGAIAGAAVEAGATIFRLTDLTEVDVIAAVPERSIAALQIGMPAVVHVPTLDRPASPGHLERIRDVLDTETRTIEAVMHVRNPGGVLRPGMFARVTLTVPGTAVVQGLRIPESSVLVDGPERIVFVQLAEATYARRAVRLADVPPDAQGQVVVLEGLSPGDRVVVRGAFTLKSELAKAALAEDAH